MHQDNQVKKSLASLMNISHKVEGKSIIDHVSLSIEPGQHITILGPNGAGKSTLIKILLKIIKPSCGEVYHQPDLKMGYVPQKLHLNHSIPMSVSRFLMKPGVAEIKDILQEVGLENSLWHKSIHTLSGGEMQRLLLARAMLSKPDLLVLDEPTQGVDVDGQLKLYALIHHLAKEHNAAVVMVSHDLHFVMKQTDHVICFNRHICCEGVPDTVMHNPEYKALFGSKNAAFIGLYQHHHDHEHR